MRTTVLLLAPFVLLLAACESDVTISPYVPPDARLTALYTRIPVVENCYAGVLRDTEGVKALFTLNELRRLHQAPAAVYAPTADAPPKNVALVMAANAGQVVVGGTCAAADLPIDRGLCVSAAAPLPAAPSAVASTAELVERMFTAGGTEQRAAMLQPYLKDIAFARVDAPAQGGGAGVSAAALNIGTTASQSLHGWLHTFVAYPFEAYPARLFDSTNEMFITLVIDRFTPSNRTANFDSTVVTVTTDAGEPLPVTVTIRRNTPNLLAWRAPVQRGVRYWVRVDRVGVVDELRQYNYWLEVE